MGQRRRVGRAAGARAIAEGKAEHHLEGESTEVLQTRLRTLQEKLAEARRGSGEANGEEQVDAVEDVAEVRALRAIPASLGRDLYGREVV